MQATSIIFETILAEIDSYIEEALDFADVAQIYEGVFNVGSSLFILASMIITFYIFKTAIVNLLQPERGFSWEELRKPLFFLILVLGYPLAMKYINFGIFLVVDYMGLVQNSLGTNSGEVLALLSEKVDNIVAGGNQLEKNSLEDSTIELVTIMKNLDDVILLKASSELFINMAYLDQFILVGFKIVAKVWLALMVIGGPIALCVSLISGGWTVFINWMKSYLSVALWIAVASLILGLLNKIMIKIVAKYIDQITDILQSISDYTGGSGIALFGFQALIGTLLQICVIMIVFIVIKLIFIAKTPQIIASWVGGGGGTSGGFAAGFLAISGAQKAGGAVAKMGAGAATGGASTVASGIGSSFKKK